VVDTSVHPESAVGQLTLDTTHVEPLCTYPLSHSHGQLLEPPPLPVQWAFDGKPVHWLRDVE
jgi:hypothetical protein